MSEESSEIEANDFGDATARVEAFGYQFQTLLSGIANDLVTLEKEGTIYAHFWNDETSDFGYHRIPFLPSEIVEFVDACKAQDEYQQALKRGLSFEDAVPSISNPVIRNRLLAGKGFVRRGGQVVALDLSRSLASFFSSELESLVCGHMPDRYERLPKLGDDRSMYAFARQICEALPVVISILANRTHGRPPYVVETEYDIQDLLRACLRPIFPDVRPEEWTPKFATTSKRVDFIIPSLDTLIEVKKIRDQGHARSVVDELMVDIESYHTHPACKHLMCVVYDPEKHIQDPDQVKEELSGLRIKNNHKFEVEVLVVN